jgi:hypothetical protein
MSEEQDKVEVGRVVTRTMMVQLLDQLSSAAPASVAKALIDIAIAIHLGDGGDSVTFHALVSELMLEFYLDSSEEMH